MRVCACVQALAEVRILKDVERLSSKLIILEKTSLESLKKENDVCVMYV